MQLQFRQYSVIASTYTNFFSIDILIYTSIIIYVSSSNFVFSLFLCFYSFPFISNKLNNSSQITWIKFSDFPLTPQFQLSTSVGTL